MFLFLFLGNLSMVSNLCLQFVYQIQNVYLIMTAAVSVLSLSVYCSLGWCHLYAWLFWTNTGKWLWWS